MRSLRTPVSVALTGALSAFALATTMPTAQATTGGELRITEFAYGGLATGAAGGDGEYAELTNIGDAPVDLSGWTYDNKAATPATALPLAALGTVAPGESVIVTDLSAAEFRAEWGLKASVKVLSNAKTHTLDKGPNAIHVYDGTGTEVDSVSYASGFESAKGKAGWVDAAHVGAKSDTTGWTIATAGDAEGSWTSSKGSIGSPGVSSLGGRTPASVRLAATGAMRITEFAYGGLVSSTSGGDGEYAELTNVGATPVDLTGWTYDNITATPATGLPLTSFGTVAPGESVIVTDLPAAEFRSDWGLKDSVKVLDNGKTHTLNKGPNAIHIYDGTGAEVDSVSYAAGFETAKGQSGWVDAAHVGAKSDTTGWTISTAGDSEGSWTSGKGSIGSPGASTLGMSTPDDVETGDGPGGGTPPEAPCQTEDSGPAPGTIPAGVRTWPGSASPTTIDPQCSWVTSLSGQDLSGLAFDPANSDILYAVKNKSHVYRLLRSGGGWVKDTANGWADGKDIRFPGGTGLPDSEGLTVGSDGALYITTERDNAASGVPLDSLLKFDPNSSATALVASDQWLLTGDLEGFTNADANLGFEGVAFVPDSFLTASGFRTDAGDLYKPANYPHKVTSGVFFAAVEKTGHLRAYVLNDDHTWVRLSDIDSGMAGVMDDSFDADLGRIWAHCDNTCGNATALMKIGSNGKFTVDRYYAAPANLPNYNLEGFAVAPASTATGGVREVLWADDGNRFGHSLWSGSLALDLGLDQTSTPTPTITGTPAIGGSLGADVGSWDAGVTTHYQWKDGNTVLGTDAPLALTDAALVNKTITLSVTGSRTGFADATTTAQVTIAAASLTTTTPAISGTPVVGKTLSVTVAPWGPGDVKLAYTWLAGGKPIAGATGTSLRLTSGLLGKAISVQVTGTKPGYADSSVSSTATAAVKAGTIAAKKPVITGAAKVGKRLVVRTGTWSAAGAKVTLRYQWFVNGKAIRGATKGRLKLVRSYRGKKITVKVTGSAPGYTTVAATSAKTRKVK